MELTSRDIQAVCDLAKEAQTLRNEAGVREALIATLTRELGTALVRLQNLADGYCAAIPSTVADTSLSPELSLNISKKIRLVE